MLEEEELTKRFNEFMEKYGDDYKKISYEYEQTWLGRSVIDFIKKYYVDVYYRPRKGENVFFQIFSAINALPPAKNPYYQFMNMIENDYGLDKNIIEVSAGYFPSLALEIAKKQKILGKGSITVYDPMIVTSQLEGMTIVRDRFTLSSPIPDNALIIGRNPCHATETIIRVANRENVPFCIELCNCDHSSNEFKLSHDFISISNMWHSYVDELVNSTLPNGYGVEKQLLNNPLLNNDEEKNNVVIKTKKLR